MLALARGGSGGGSRGGDFCSSGVGAAALFGRAVVVGFKAVLHTESLPAQLTGDGHEFLLAASFLGAAVLARLDHRVRTACTDVLIDLVVDIVAWLDADGLHTQRAHWHVLVVARLHMAAVVLVAVVLKAEFFGTPITGEGQKVIFLAAPAQGAGVHELGELHPSAYFLFVATT